MLYFELEKYHITTHSHVFLALFLLVLLMSHVLDDLSLKSTILHLYYMLCSFMRLCILECNDQRTTTETKNSPRPRSKNVNRENTPLNSSSESDSVPDCFGEFASKLTYKSCNS